MLLSLDIMRQWCGFHLDIMGDNLTRCRKATSRLNVHQWLNSSRIWYTMYIGYFPTYIYVYIYTLYTIHWWHRIFPFMLGWCTSFGYPASFWHLFLWAMASSAMLNNQRVYIYIIHNVIYHGKHSFLICSRCMLQLEAMFCLFWCLFLGSERYLLV